MTEQVTASHILVETEQQAKDIINQIKQGSLFEDMAKYGSKCPSGKSGGNLGPFTRGRMVKPFEDAAFGLEVGALSEPVQTQFGWHVILRTA